MGYPTLDAALAFPNNVPPSKSHIVVTDTLQSSANFLIHHFVGNQLKTGGNVILVGLSQIFNHYFFISRKLGINLSTYKQSGQFVFIDGLTHLNEYAHESPYPPANTPTMPTDTLDGSTIKNTDLLKHFYGHVKQHIVGKTRPVLILDDANVLLACGFGLDRVSHLLSRLKVLMEQNDGTLITIVHADESSAEDEEQDAFVRNVLNSAHLVLQVQALNSGLARDVHGELSIIHGPQCVKSNTQPQSLHYRILDNNAEFFAKGYNK